MKTTTRVCVLCHHSAQVTDWEPVAAWLAVEGCQCGGYLVRTFLWDSRLATLSDTERKDIAARVRTARAARV